MYYSIFGDLAVPQDFTVPDNEPWPKACYYCSLGITIHSIRVTKGTLSEERKKNN